MNQTLTNWTKPGATNSSLTRLNRGNFIDISLVVYYVMLCCSAVLNIMVVFVMLRSGKIRQNISSFLICHLSFTHLLFHFTIPILRIDGSFNVTSSASCKATVVIDFACAAAIFSSLAAIAWDRYRNILRPFQSMAPRKLKTYLLLVASIWSYAFIISVPFIYSVRTHSRENCSKEKNGTENCEEYRYCSLPTDRKTQLTKTLYFLLAFAVPLVYMFSAYTKIAVRLWKRSKNGTIHGAVAKCKIKSTRLMVIAVVGFVFCWGPTFVVQLLEVYGVLAGWSYEYSVILYLWCAIAQASSSSINPAIYAFLSPEFRRSVLKYCCCCCCWSRGVFPCHRCGSSRVEPVM